MKQSTPKLYLQIGNQDEIEVGDITNNLRFLGDDYNPTITNSYQENTGQDGSDFNIATFNKSVITARFWLHFTTWNDYKMAKSEIYNTLMTKDLIRYRTDVEPAKVKYVRVTTFQIQPTEDYAHDCLFTIAFDNPSGCSYSLYPSNQLYKYSAESWQYGMNLPIPVGKLNYNFVDETNIYVFNAGIDIDPYMQKHDLKIIMKRYGNQSFGLVNNTTNTSWNYHGSLGLNDTLILDGINTYKNGITDNLNSDYGYLMLAHGWNNISITGVKDLDVTFSFPFIYLA